MVAIHCNRASTASPVGAEPKRLSEPLVEIRERPAAVLAVAHDPYRHGRADDAGHRPDGAVIVAGLEPNRAALDEPSRADVIVAPILPSTTAPTIAPCIGPHILVQAIGGPA